MRPSPFASLFCLALSCGGGGATTPPTTLSFGRAETRLSTVPSDVLCLRMLVVGASGSSIDTRFDVTPGARSTLTLEQLPPGAVTVTAYAYGQDCTSWSSSLAPTWTGVPFTDTLAAGRTANWRITMHHAAAQQVPSNNSTITATPSTGVGANGVTQSLITVTLLDANSSPVPSITPLLAVSGSGNALSACSASNSAGVSTCTLASTWPSGATPPSVTKTISFISPALTATATVTFVLNPFTCTGGGTFFAVSAVTTQGFFCQSTSALGTTPLSVFITDQTTPAFAIVNDNCSNRSVMASSPCSFGVQFPAASGNPTSGTTYSANLHVTAFPTAATNGGSTLWPLSGTLSGGGGGTCGIGPPQSPCTQSSACISCVCTTGLCQ